MEKYDEIIFKLLKDYKWSHEQIELGLRANFKCEYCNKDLFESVDNYKLWEVDHIIPFNSNIPNFDYDNFDNKAIACRQCNTNYKSKYNPVDEIGYNKNREDYLTIIKEKVSSKRLQKQNELDSMKILFSNLMDEKK